jgi:hypothetical protein
VPESAHDIGAWLPMFELLSLGSVLTNAVVIAFCSQSPLFRQTFWTGTGARLGWFIMAETALFAYKYVTATFVPNATPAAELQRARTAYLTRKHVDGLDDEHEEAGPKEKDL